MGDIDFEFIIILIVVAVIYFVSLKIFERLFPNASYSTIRLATKLTTVLVGLAVGFLIVKFI